jgi:cytochrome c oxidase subunit III
MTTGTHERPRIDVAHLPDIGFDWRSPLWWGNLLGIFIETTTVALLLATYFYVARNFPDFPPPRVDVHPAKYHPVPDLTAGTWNTVLLVGSCIPMWWTDRAARRKQRGKVIVGLAVMLAAAVGSIVLRRYEFAAVHFKWDANAYGSIVWTLLVTHLIYVIIGVGEFLLMGAYVVMKPIDNKHGLDVTLAGGYWYWTAGIWVLIYATIYFAPRVL